MRPARADPRVRSATLFRTELRGRASRVVRDQRGANRPREPESNRRPPALQTGAATELSYLSTWRSGHDIALPLRRCFTHTVFKVLGVIDANRTRVCSSTSNGVVTLLESAAFPLSYRPETRKWPPAVTPRAPSSCEELLRRVTFAHEPPIAYSNSRSSREYSRVLAVWLASLGMSFVAGS